MNRMLETKAKRVVATFFMLVVPVATSVLQAQVGPQRSISSFERQVRQTAAEVVPAVLKLYHFNDSTGDRRFTGSAVVVSPDGLVLTVAHVNTPGRLYLGRFPDGREVRVRGLGEVQRLDAAMMQIEDKGVYPYVAMGRSALLAHGEPTVSFGYAGSLQHDLPTVRLGHVVRTTSNRGGAGGARMQRMGRLQTTSLMEPGDSGGAVFDLYGRLIGLRSSINRSLDANYEIPIDHYYTYWQAMLTGEEFAELPDSLAVPLPVLDSGAQRVMGHFVPYSDTTQQLIAEFARLNVPVLGIESLVGDSSVPAQATPLESPLFSELNAPNRSYLVSKSSIVGEAPTVVEGLKKPIVAEVVFRDEERDLVLLAIPRQRNWTAHRLDQGIEIAVEAVGSFLHSPLAAGSAKFSVLGSPVFSIAGQSRVGYFGAALEERENGVVVIRVQDGSPARDADLDVGMRLLSIDHEAILSPAAFVNKVQSKRPGDVILVEYLVGEQSVLKEVTLATRPLITGSHIAEHFEGGKSVVRDGFSKVFPHDARLHPFEMGGPVVDLRGHFLGINIARLSRTTTLAMPIEELRAFLLAAQAAGAL